MNERLNNAAKLLQQKDFVKRAANAESVSAILELFRENGAELTPEELAALLQNNAGEEITMHNTELSEQELAQVAGGGNMPTLDDFKQALLSLFGA
ncbi:MAG: hypothetical protein IKN55_00160 [Oscillospiraceae bacterium]|nr:hypothetical protein [Oscillospiraceae bacterium]